ncbi:NAD(P)-binding domain-containing protein [Halocynthiibacter sp.]|uniref:NAD(P)-binding domain-containing protein n=1 Tax=Halocynthiibacter sp. TaxID=1979210 RepID=UPI003C44A5FE
MDTKEGQAMKIGVIGCGTIASAVVRGIAHDGHQITVSRRSTQQSHALSATFDCVSIADNQTVLNQSDVIFLGLIAEQASDILSDLKFHPDHQVISLMAGADLEKIAMLVGPAKNISIMIPFPNIATGGSPVLALGDIALIENIFTPDNTVFPLENPEQLQACLAAQAVLSPTLKLVNTAETWLQEHCPGVAEGFLSLLISSNLSGQTTGDALQALDTPGGYNQRLRNHMEDVGMSDALKQGLTALTDKT